jgi:Domain of unknown function (DUF4333)
MREMRGGVGALAVLSLASVVMAAGCSSPPTLRSGDVEDQIASGLVTQVGGEFSVVCPTSVRAEAGTTFTCTATDGSGGGTVTVIVTESDDTGGFEWRVQAPVASASPVASPS